jgi:hypothetical protein
MKIHQLSLFLENKPGALRGACKTLADAGINISTLSLADTERFGILRLIVKEWQRAKSVLEAAGCVVNITEVVAIQVEDRPGGLDAILTVSEARSLSIEYLYAFATPRGEKAVLIFRFADTDVAIAALQAARANVLGSVELYEGARA